MTKFDRFLSDTYNLDKNGLKLFIFPHVDTEIKDETDSIIGYTYEPLTPEIGSFTLR